MKNLIKTIECTIQHCSQGFHSFNSKQVRGTDHLFDGGGLQRNLVLLLLILLVPIFSIVAQDQKAIKAKVQEDKVYYTPQLAGSSPTVKPTITRTVVRNIEEKSSEPKDNIIRSNSTLQMSWTQLMAKVTASQMTSEVTIYTGALDQCAPQIVTNGSVMYVAFESYDTQSGTFPYGSIQIYQSTNGGSSWSSWNYISSSLYHLYSPQIVLIGSGAVVVSYQRNGGLRTIRLDLTNVNPDVPLPTSSTNEYVVANRMVSDVEQYPSFIWYLFFCVRMERIGSFTVVHGIQEGRGVCLILMDRELSILIIMIH